MPQQDYQGSGYHSAHVMAKETHILFDPFSLDTVNECVWRGSTSIKIKPKAFAVLTYLLSHPGQLITKEELISAVWPKTHVGNEVLKVTIGQIRKALNDDPRSPRFIETAHRRGYRFIGQIDKAGPAPSLHSTPGVGGRPLRPYSLSRSQVVGRDRVLSQMQGCLRKTLDGVRQTLFVTGEAGIGKTSIVDTFAELILADGNIRVARGQCLEHFGKGEAFLPVLDAIGKLCREHQQAIELMRTHAPLWLSQMPALIGPADRETLNREVIGATRERMLREMSGALEVLTATGPLVLILEDLHWSDFSTLDLISYLARQRQPAQLMLIGTFRNVELIVHRHPLHAVKQELLAKQQCEELPLEYLNEDAIAEYLSARFVRNKFPKGLAALIHERTDGNPLFMVNAVDYLVQETLIVEVEDCWELSVDIENVVLGVPESIRQMIEKQLDHLDEERRRTLEAASVAGAEFSVLALEAGLEFERTRLEANCDDLARHHQFIRHCGAQELPNGEVISRYGFIHALYQNVLYDRLSVPRRAQMHRLIGERGEQIYGDRSKEIAAELAMHFERGRDFHRSAQYHQQAADNAIRRFAYPEAVGLARRGIRLLKALADSTERAQLELSLQLTLGAPLVAIEGYAAPEIGTAYKRARELSQQLGETPDVSEVLWGLWAYYLVRAELETAREIATEFVLLSERLPFPGLAVRGHLALEITLIHIGEFELSLEQFDKARSIYDNETDRNEANLYSQDSGVAMLGHASWALWLLGQAAQADARIEGALERARDLSEPHGLAHALFMAAFLCQLRRDVKKAQTYAEAGLAISVEHGLGLYLALTTVIRGWALAEQHIDGAIEIMREGIAALEASHTILLHPHFLSILALALARTQQLDEALKVIDEAISMAKSTGEGYYEPELHRIKGEIVFRRKTGRELSTLPSNLKSQSTPDSEVLSSFKESLTLAQKRDAKAWQLRTTTSLARLYHHHDRAKEARELLAPIYDWFKEKETTPDQVDAKTVLEQLPV